MAVLYIEFDERVAIADYSGLSFPADEGKGVAIAPEIVFEASEGPKDRIDNAGNPFPEGTTDFSAGQTPTPQA